MQNKNIYLTKASTKRNKNPYNPLKILGAQIDLWNMVQMHHMKAKPFHKTWDTIEISCQISTSSKIHFECINLINIYKMYRFAFFLANFSKSNWSFVINTSSKSHMFNLTKVFLIIWNEHLLNYSNQWWSRNRDYLQNFSFKLTSKYLKLSF